MRRIASSFGIALCFLSLPAFAVVSEAIKPGTFTTLPADSKGVVTSIDTNDVPFLDSVLNAPDRPKWMTRTHIGWGGQRKNTSSTELVTTQPFYGCGTRPYFMQGRVAYNYGELTGNAGLGYRYLTNDKSMLWGINAFFDDATQFKFKRYGLGGELFTTIFVFRADIYSAVSNTSVTARSFTSGFTTYQRPLSGFDGSIEAPVPNFSWARFVVQGYRYIGNRAENITGGGANFRVFIARQLEVDAGFISDNVNGNQTFAKFDYYFGSADFIQNTLSTESFIGTIAPLDLEKQILQKVVRNNNVVVEQTVNGIPDYTEAKVLAI